MKADNEDIDADYIVDEKARTATLTQRGVQKAERHFNIETLTDPENMTLQHTESTDTVSMVLEPEAPVEEIPAEKKKYGVVAVSNGDGVEALFKELGTDVVVQGGQTQNPSTNDFLDAFEKVNAEHIFVFPNNGNIIMAANQAAEIYDKAEIHVIESKNLGDGYVAICSADFESEDAEAVAAGLREAMASVTTGYVSPSIRDAELNGIEIHNGDFIGFIGKQMLAAHPDKAEAAQTLLSKMLEDGEKYMLTVFCGKDATVEEAAALEAHVSETYPDIEAYFLRGEQDVYPYIFVAE